MSDPVTLEAYRILRSGTGQEATLDDLWNCYRLLLNREPDPAGFLGYSAIVRRGMTTDELVRMFVASPEYARRMTAPPDPTITRARLDDFDLYVPQADAVVGEEILTRGVYEPHVTAALSAVLREGQCVVDVGANVGYFTMLAARRVGPRGHVVALEPLPRNVRLLLANTRINAADNVRVLPFGAAEREGFITLLSIGSIASSRETDLDDVTTVNGFEVAYAKTLDGVVPDERPVDVLKIDIDGFDHRALLGARQVLTRSHPRLFAEFAPALLAEFSRIQPIQYLKLMLDYGYNDFTVLTREAEPIPMGVDIDRIARMPAELGATHVDLHVRRV